MRCKQYLVYEIVYKKNTKEIDKRIIRIPININVNTYYQKCLGGINNNVKENNTSINNTRKKEIYKERFVKPTLAEIKEYCLQRNNNVNANKFYDYYEANNWSDSKGNKVKSWKQKVITWETHAPKQKEDIIPNWFNKKEHTLTEINKKDQEELNQLINEMSDY